MTHDRAIELLRGIPMTQKISKETEQMLDAVLRDLKALMEKVYAYLEVMEQSKRV